MCTYDNYPILLFYMLSVAYRKTAENFLGGNRKTNKRGGNGEQAHRRGGEMERESKERGRGRGGGGRRTMSAGTPNSGGTERSVPRTDHAIESTCTPTKSIPGAVSGGGQPPFLALNVSETVFRDEDERNERSPPSTMRPRKLVRKRPTSAAAVIPSATNNKGRGLISPAALTAHGRAAFEDHHTTGGKTSTNSPSNKRGPRPREVPICWGAEKMAGKRPTPLGKTNTSKLVAKVVKRVLSNGCVCEWLLKDTSEKSTHLTISGCGTRLPAIIVVDSLQKLGKGKPL